MEFIDEIKMIIIVVDNWLHSINRSLLRKMPHPILQCVRTYNCTKVRTRTPLPCTVQSSSQGANMSFQNPDVKKLHRAMEGGAVQRNFG